MIIDTDSDILRLAYELAEQGSPVDKEAAISRLVEAAGKDRNALETARDAAAMRLHGDPSDWRATGALTLLNYALSSYGRKDPYDWRVRWAQHRKP